MPIKDTDLLAINRDGVDYQVSYKELADGIGGGKSLKDYPDLPCILRPDPDPDNLDEFPEWKNDPVCDPNYLDGKAPWLDIPDKNVRLHIKNNVKGYPGSRPLKLKEQDPDADIQIWDIDGTERTFAGSPSIQPGEEVVVISTPEKMFVTQISSDGGSGDEEPNLGNWEFGCLTDTSKGENFNEMFANCAYFNSSLSMFDMSNAKSAAGMLLNTSFKYDVSRWDMSKCTNFDQMFQRIGAFNQDLSGLT